MRNTLRLMAVAASLLLCSCAKYSDIRYPAFEGAMNLPQTVAESPVFDDTARPDSLPHAVPYLQVNGDFYSATPPRQAWLLREHAVKGDFAPDFLTYRSFGTAYAGSTSQHVGFGVAVSTPVYRPQGTAWCFRITDATPGIRWQNSGFVDWLSDEAQAIGLLEGDTLVSIDGAGVTPKGTNSPAWHARALAMRAGQKVEVVWIRPGSGRMSGVLAMQENTAMPRYGVSMDQQYDRETASRRRR